MTGPHRASRSSNMNHHHVLLLKNQEAGAPYSEDPYISALSARKLRSSIVPTLSHVYHEPERLAETIRQGAVGRYEGVIYTSGRAVDSWENVISQLEFDRASHGWQDVPFYVVGPRTKSRLLSLRSRHPGYVPPADLILGEQAGTGEALAQLISTDYAARNVSGLPLLYLAGDKTTGGAESGLKEAKIDVVKIQVYATSASKAFAEDFEDAMTHAHGHPVCVVFFAPSSAELALPTIRKHFAVQTTSHTELDPRPLIKVACIGPTTARALTDRFGIAVDVVSEKPEPRSLAEAICLLEVSSAAV